MHYVIHVLEQKFKKRIRVFWLVLKKRRKRIVEQWPTQTVYV